MVHNGKTFDVFCLLCPSAQASVQSFYYTIPTLRQSQRVFQVEENQLLYHAIVSIMTVPIASY